MRSILCFVFLLSGCTTISASAPPPTPLKSAGAEVKSWGVTLRRWTMDDAGHVEHTSGQRVGGNRTDMTIEVRRLTLNQAQRAALAQAVTKVESVLAEPEQCDERVTDGPYGTFRWDRDGQPNALPFDGNCVRGRDYRLTSAIFAADAIVDNAAKATQPVERHPLSAE